ncbi:MAG TPA: hypothetical protein VKX28_16850 [Xanthobacteraceae bacterium]|jgi:hypothetical protein|nr:hypothetical protein [Xanthobacteraceae bacterium]
MAIRKTSIIAGTLLTALAATNGSYGQTDLGWRRLDDPASGTRVEYPSKLFTVEEPSHSRGRPGQLFGTADGRAHLAVFAVHDPRHRSAAAFIARNLRVPAATLHYERTTATFFALSGIHRDNIYYARCNSSPDHALLHCINMVYPAQEKRRWDSIVTRISRTLGAAQ